MSSPEKEEEAEKPEKNGKAPTAGMKIMDDDIDIVVKVVFT